MRNIRQGGVRAQVKRALGAGAVAGLAGLAMAPAAAHAADVAADAAAAAADVQEVDKVDVTGGRPKQASTKYTAELRDTPQTITIISQETISAQSLFSLREILSTQPGITFGAGEGGGGYGDSINLRGFSANNDITVDGIRDSAQYTRSDPFNLEQVEVINGANSVYSGSGSVGGTINIVSKSPKVGDSTLLTAGLGTDAFGRLAVDTNKMLGDTTAVRLNVMTHQNDVPGRDVEKFQRWGVAPSIAFGLGTTTEMSFAYLHQEDDNIPQYGIPFFVNATYSGSVPGIDRSKYFGYSNVDKQENVIDALTFKGRHEFSDTFSINNITRYQEVTQFVRVNPPQGTICLANGLTPAGGSCGTVAPGFYQPSGPRGTTRDSKNTILYTQTDLRKTFATGPVSHNLVAGFSISSEDYHLDSGNSLRNPLGAGTNPVLPVMSLANPNNVYTGPINFIVTARSDGSMDNKAVYLFDTAELTEKLQFNVGLRYEKTEGEFFSTAIATPYPTTGNPVETVSPPGRNENTLFSYRAGLVYKPIEAASLYVAYGNSQTPSQASVNGGCVATSTTGGANCNVDPEKGVNIEVGGKWEVAGGRLLLTGALFRNERSNYRVPSGDPTLPDQVLDGKARVDGVSLGANGKITEKWTIFANYTFLDSEVLQSVSDRVLQGTGIDAQKGNPLTNTPEHSGSLWTTYALPHNITIGYGATYSGEYYLNNGAPPLFKMPSYWMHSAMASWKVNDKTDLQLNIKNVTDELYFQRGRNNGWATPGDARSAVLTLNYRL